MTCISTISKSHFESDDFGLLGSDDEAHVAPSGRGDVKREKRLERNRESARKCRKKRKAYVGDLEAKVQSVEEENAMLQLENQRLNALLKQLQAGAKDISVPEPSRKRVKSEFGVSMANDFSESAAGEIFAGHFDHLTANDACELDSGCVSTDTCLGSSSTGPSPDDCIDLPPAKASSRPVVVKSEKCCLGDIDIAQDEPPEGFMESFVSDSSYCDLVSSLGSVGVEGEVVVDPTVGLDQFIDL